MSADVWVLVATAVLAVVAIGAAAVAVRAARRPAPSVEAAAVEPPTPSVTSEIVMLDPVVSPAGREPSVVDGRLVMPPSEQQVVQAALGRPGVRLSVVAHGLAFALRAESRDRIVALMRREYRRRRRERLQAGRRAVRAAQPTPPSDQWLGS
ncbi:MAG: hypothetical protein JWP31_921 [Aeromicrobium sp.]|nr:hypothetical protein [Aeromicrobium sp.]